MSEVEQHPLGDQPTAQPTTRRALRELAARQAAQRSAQPAQQSMQSEPPTGLSRRELRELERRRRAQEITAAPPEAATGVLTASSLIAFDEVEVDEPQTAPVSKPVPVRPGVAPEQRAAAPSMANTADTVPTPIIRRQDTQPQPVLGADTVSQQTPTPVTNPESIRRMRASTLRGRRIAAPAAPTRPPAKPRRRAAGAIRRVAAGGILLVASAFVVATTVPAQAFHTESGGAALAEWEHIDAQTIEVPANASQLELNIDGDIGIEDALAGARISAAEIAEIQAIASVDTPAGGFRSGVTGYERALPLLATSYVQTPFPNHPDVPISSGFEWRWGKVHEAVDFTPGAGTEIRPMANGIVTNIQLGTGSGGHMVTVDHIIDGKRYQTVYAHMIAGSIQVAEGQVVTIDTVLGQVGSTGFSTGPHLHFELRTADDLGIDAIRWWSDRTEYTAADAALGVR